MKGPCLLGKRRKTGTWGDGDGDDDDVPFRDLAGMEKILETVQVSKDIGVYDKNCFLISQNLFLHL